MNASPGDMPLCKLQQDWGWFQHSALTPVQPGIVKHYYDYYYYYYLDRQIDTVYMH